MVIEMNIKNALYEFRRVEEISRNKLVALMASICLQEAKGSYIVTDSVTSSGLKEFIEEKGGVHHRFKRGYKNVINEAKRLNEEGIDCPLAIETSGHAALRERKKCQAFLTSLRAYGAAKEYMLPRRMAGNEADISAPRPDRMEYFA